MDFAIFAMMDAVKKLQKGIGKNNINLFVTWVWQEKRDWKYKSESEQVFTIITINLIFPYTSSMQVTCKMLQVMTRTLPQKKGKFY